MQQAYDDEVVRLATQRLMLSYDPGFKEADMESDTDLRKRLIYVLGNDLLRELQYGSLDDVAARFGLKRRKIDREATQPVRMPESWR